MMNKFDLAKIFYSNYTASTDWEMMEEISLMLEERMLDIQSIVAASYADFLKAIDQINTGRYKHVVESGDSIRHQALKIVATNFLINRFNLSSDDIKYELPFFGYEVDVCDKGFKYLCECGDTNSKKLEFYLTQPDVESMVIFPYPKDSNSLTAYLFTPRPIFKEYISFKHQYMRDKIKR